jgi:hypothetical protein
LMEEGLLTYRHAWARPATFLLGGIAVVTVAFTLWQPSLLPFTVLVCAFAWFAALAWPFPMLRLDEDGITVRNPFSTTTIPYASVADVTGGSRLEIEGRGGLKVVAAAVPGSNFTMQAMRKQDTYGEFFNPATSVDDLRIDAGEPDTAATRIANIIRRQVNLVGIHRQTTAAPVRTLNVATIAVTAAIVAVGAIGLIVR